MNRRRRISSLLGVLGLGLALFWLLGGTPASESSVALAQAGTGVIRVATAGTDAPGCGGEGNPCRTVQYAVNQASDGDTVEVATGVYTDLHARPAPAAYVGPSVITQVVYISKTLTLSGGYTTTNWASPDPQAHPTVLDAQGRGRVLFIAEGAAPTLTGLEVTGGDASDLGGALIGFQVQDVGGGAFVLLASPSIENCRIMTNTAAYGGGVYVLGEHAALSGDVISGNTAEVNGGGVYLQNSHAVLSGNTISGNQAVRRGGGMYLAFDNARLEGNIISSNTVTAPGDGGGGLYLLFSDATLRANLIADNVTPGSGAGLWLDYSNCTLEGNLFIGNAADLSGGGLYVTNSAPFMMTNNVIAGNAAAITGGGLCVSASKGWLRHSTIANNGDAGVYATGSTALHFTNTIVVSQTVGLNVLAGSAVTLEATLWHGNGADTSGGGSIVTGTVNFWGDPAFADPMAGDYHLREGSTALDRGIDAGVTSDLDYEPRPYHAPDLGADEYWPPGALKRLYLPLVLRNYT